MKISDDGRNELTMLVVAVYSSLNKAQPVFPELHEQEGRADLCFKHVMNRDEVPI